MKRYKIPAGNYIIQLVKERWYHRLFRRPLRGHPIATMGILVCISKKGKLFIYKENALVSLTEGDLFVEDSDTPVTSPLH